MKNPTPLPLEKIASTVHEEAKTAVTRLAAIAISDCVAFSSGEVQREYFQTIHAWANRNLANIARSEGGTVSTQTTTRT